MYLFLHLCSKSFVPVIFCVGIRPVAKCSQGFGTAAEPDQNQAYTRDPAGQKRQQRTAGWHREGTFLTSLFSSWIHSDSVFPLHSHQLGIHFSSPLALFQMSLQKSQMEREVEEQKQKLLRSEQSLQASQTKEQDLRKKMEVKYF